MAEFETVDYSKLETLNLALTNFFAHSTPNGRLYKNTISELATFLAPYIAGVGASEYVNITSNVLPDPVSANKWSIVAAGTYTQTGEGNLVLTNVLNIIYWNGTTWSLTKGIDIDLSNYILKSDIVNDLTTGGADKPLSAEQGKIISSSIFEDLTAPLNEGSASTTDWLLVKNYPFPDDGIISNIEVRAYEAGKLKFQVLNRNTISSNSYESSDSFSPVKTFTLDVFFGRNSYNLPIELDVLKGQYLGVAKENASINNPPFTANPPGVIEGVWTNFTSGTITGTTNLTLKEYDVDMTFTLKTSTFQNKKQTVNIIATRNVDNYNSIKNIQDGISDASEYKNYEIYVPKGNWFELDIRGKKYVKIVCHPDALIYCDATQTDPKYVVPVGYPYADQIGKQVATVPSTLLHVLFVSADTDIEGGSIKMIRGKYAAHIDTPSFKNAFFKNVKFESEQSIHPVGIGIWGGQHLKFENCTYKSLDSEFGFAIHNTANQLEGSLTELVNNKWIGCSYLKIDELGSNQKDVINIFDSTTDGRKSVLFAAPSADGTNSYWKDSNGNTTTNPLDIPYCFEVNDNGTDIDWLRIVFYFWSAYPNVYTRNIRTLLDKGFNSYAFRAKCNGAINKGDVVYQRNYAAPYSEILKYTPSATNPIGIALENGDAGNYVYCAKIGSIAGAIVDGNPFNSIAAAKLTFDGATGHLKSNDSALYYEVMAEAIGSDIEGRTFVKLK